MNKKFIFPAGIVVMGIAVLVFNLMTDIKKESRLPVGADMPSVELTDIGTGIDIKSSELRGKVLFVNFWATWCPPCIEEMPYINKLYNKFKNNSDFKMITIAYNDDPKRCLDFVKEKGFSLPVFFDPFGKAASQFGITGIPETFIIDKSGKIRKLKIGPDRWDSQENISLIMSLLNQQK